MKESSQIAIVFDKIRMTFQTTSVGISNAKLKNQAFVLVAVSISLYIIQFFYYPVIQRNSSLTKYSLKKLRGETYGNVRNTWNSLYIPIKLQSTKVSHHQNARIKIQAKRLSRKKTTNNSLRIILMWNEWNLNMADELLGKVQCPTTSCLFTTDTSLIQQSDVVVLHFDTLEDFPMNRLPHQRFVFYHFESPANTASQLMDDPRFRFNYFNWTMTYRRDSDVFLRDYYGSIVSKRSFITNIRKIRYLYEQKVSNQSDIVSHDFPISLANIDLNLSSIIRRKTKMVTWLVGNCFTPIRREEYVHQLSQYIPVDIFGQCAKECPSNCDEMIRTDYKFYLAFENSWCPDYITEKFSRPFVYDAIPVVLGGADYSQFAPPNSYINARDFSSPKHLADYLLMLDKTDSLYARYFEWKRDYYISVPDMYGWCELCRMAHDSSLPPKIYADIKKWWMLDGGECEPNSTKYF